MAEMDLATFTAAFEATVEPPSLEKLEQRYTEVFQRTNDVHTALAAVNEISPDPMTFEGFMQQLDRAA